MVSANQQTRGPGITEFKILKFDFLFRLFFMQGATSSLIVKMAR